MTPETFEPETSPTSTVDTKDPGKEGPGKRLTTPIRTAPDKGNAKAPYYQPEEAYIRAAAEALEKDKVPPAYRTKVKEYFESLDETEPPARGGGEAGAGEH